MRLPPMIHALCGDLPPALVGLLLVVFMAMTVSTRQYAAAWRSELAIWTHAAALAPQKPRALNNLAVALLASGNLARAREWFERAQVAAARPDRPSWDRVEGVTVTAKNLQALDALDATVAQVR